MRAQLYVAFDLGYMDERTFRGLLEQAEEVSRIVNGLHASVGQVRHSQAANR